MGEPLYKTMYNIFDIIYIHKNGINKVINHYSRYFVVIFYFLGDSNALWNLPVKCRHL